MSDGREPAGGRSQESLSRREALRVGIAALASLGLGETISLQPGECVADALGSRHLRPGERGISKAPHDYRQARQVTSVCLNCSTVCGIVGQVIDGQVVKLAGNPVVSSQ